MARYTWRKVKRKSGGMRMPKSYTLHNGTDAPLAHAQQDGPSGLWFWYADGKNTADNKRPLPLVLDEARTWVKAQRATQEI